MLLQDKEGLGEKGAQTCIAVAVPSSLFLPLASLSRLAALWFPQDWPVLLPVGST